MRRGALLLVVLAGVLATAGAAALGSGHASRRFSPVAAITLSRAELADAAVVAHARDDAVRELDTRRDLAVVLGVLLAPLLAGWWFVVERQRASERVRPRAIRRTRAPPRVSITVHC